MADLNVVGCHIQSYQNSTRLAVPREKGTNKPRVSNEKHYQYKALTVNVDRFGNRIVQTVKPLPEKDKHGQAKRRPSKAKRPSSARPSRASGASRASRASRPSGPSRASGASRASRPSSARPSRPSSARPRKRPSSVSRKRPSSARQQKKDRKVWGPSVERTKLPEGLSIMENVQTHNNDIDETHSDMLPREVEERKSWGPSVEETLPIQIDQTVFVPDDALDQVIQRNDTKKTKQSLAQNESNQPTKKQKVLSDQTNSPSKFPVRKVDTIQSVKIEAPSVKLSSRHKIENQVKELQSENQLLKKEIFTMKKIVQNLQSRINEPKNGHLEGTNPFNRENPSNSNIKEQTGSSPFNRNPLSTQYSPNSTSPQSYSVRIPEKTGSPLFSSTKPKSQYDKVKELEEKLEYVSSLRRDQKRVVEQSQFDFFKKRSTLRIDVSQEIKDSPEDIKSKIWKQASQELAKRKFS